MAEVFDMSALKTKRLERDMYNRWTEFYREQPYEELLELLVYEHENDFPLKRSDSAMDKARHQAMVKVLDEKAQTGFLRSFLEEIRDAMPATNNPTWV